MWHSRQKSGQDFLNKSMFMCLETGLACLFRAISSKLRWSNISDDTISTKIVYFSPFLKMKPLAGVYVFTIFLILFTKIIGIFQIMCKTLILAWKFKYLNRFRQFCRFWKKSAWCRFRIFHRFSIFTTFFKK